MRSQLSHKYEDIISVENLLLAWEEFVKGKRSKLDVQKFQLHLMDNIIALHCDLANHTYQHGSYQAFRISDPKPRQIHKASVRDRLLHHAIYRILYPFFDRTFIADSYSCRLDKGTHKAVDRFRTFAYKVSQNNTKTCWVLKCDIRKFFSSIDHQIILKTLREYIPDKSVLWLLNQVIRSFLTTPGKGLPLGNLTSQLLVNIYMNQFDQWVKHKLKAKYYVRYADDFVFLARDQSKLKVQLAYIQVFLRDRLYLEIPDSKTSINTLASGIDFLGWVNFVDHRVLRTKTRRRMFKQLTQKHIELDYGFIDEFSYQQSLQSYLGILQHGCGYNLGNMVKNSFGKFV
jgi:RNA-directed DNA polymerase